MIPRATITAWSQSAPWPTQDQIEQDLLLSRVLIEIYQDPELADELVFRGGTCLHKLHLTQPRRYSEDLDFVRTSAGGIASLTQALSRLGERLGFQVATRVSQQPKVYLRTTAASGTSLRIKIEINTRERSPALPLVQLSHAVSTAWWSGRADVRTFAPPELVATKIRALFQRKKGRDLFDLWLALTELKLPPADILAAYPVYAPAGLTARRSEADLRRKLDEADFRDDLRPLIDPWPDDYDLDKAGELVIKELLSQIPTP